VGIKRIIAGMALAGISTFVLAAPAAAVHTTDSEGTVAVASIGSSLGSVAESDTDGWSMDYSSRAYKAFGAGVMASLEVSQPFAGPLFSEVSQSYKAGPLVVDVDYYRKGAKPSGEIYAGPLSIGSSLSDVI
jgi:hypothetical protein